MPEVYFYALRRASPNFNLPEKDEWSIPGAATQDEALIYFEKDIGFRLKQVEDAFNGEFVLEQRERIVREFGARTSIQPGAVIATSWVSRATP